MTKILISFLGIFLINTEFAYDVAPEQVDNTDAAVYVSGASVLQGTPDNTPCATDAFARALATYSNEVSQTDNEIVVQDWIRSVFSKPDVLDAVLACREIAEIDDTDTIRFMPVEYTFPSGRKITVNYATQPKILKQRLVLGTRPALPSSEISPRIGDENDDTIWVNVDPAWYAIMVVQTGTMDAFVGPDKNNTIALDYIKDNIDELYPRGFMCTSKSALALNAKMINKAVTKTVGIGKDDTNDYYVAGDVDLRWISYAEMALDVVITVVTMGSGTVILGTTKAVRASRALKGLGTTMRKLRNANEVREFIQLGRRSEQLGREVKTLQKEIQALDRVTDAAEIARREAEIVRHQKEIATAADRVRELEKFDNVREYKEVSATYHELREYRQAFKSAGKFRRGNTVVRGWNMLKSTFSGNKLITKANKLGRSSTFSGRVRDKLFNWTFQNLGALGRMEAEAGALYGVVTVLKYTGEFLYDFTDTTTGEFTNNMEFAPLLLLSADDLPEQGNVVNHGMWLMWAGDSTNPADDDAAFLSAMDFASKFHQDLIETQEEENSNACNVDIFVVRPIIRNPGTDDARLYFLIMNDVPWTVTK